MATLTCLSLGLRAVAGQATLTPNENLFADGLPPIPASLVAPLALVQNITKPMLVIHGENDPRVPVSEAHQIVDAARANKAPAWLLLGKNEGHGFARKSNLDFQFYSTIQFVRQYLLAETQTP
jgi:fermentation-respiration switch protein FrsA (DUF1100 family)